MNDKLISAEKTVQIQITGRHVEVTQGIKEHIHQKAEKLLAFVRDRLKIDVKLIVDRHQHSVYLHLALEQFRVNVHDSERDLYVAIDKAIEKAHSKLRKWKSKMHAHHQKTVKTVNMDVDVLHPLEEEDSVEFVSHSFPPKVARKKVLPLKTLTLEEAVMKMELSDDMFKIYRSEEEGIMKVIYRRKDGTYGVITPKG